jgi:hypothetical protein
MFRKRRIMKDGRVPKLVIAEHAVDKIMKAATQYAEDETGEAMIGFMLPGDDLLTYYVMETISPDDSAVRHTHTFQQGDPWQDEMIWWMQENWRVRREKDHAGTMWDAPLRYLGDWHKQPGYMIAPSGGDLQTALDWLDDPENGQDALLVPIVTLGHPATTDDSPNTNYFTRHSGDGSALRVDWWYIHRDVRRFQPMTPEVLPGSDLPRLVVNAPWHLRDEDRFNLEFKRLRQNGLISTPTIANIDGVLPLEFCIAAARMDGSRIFLIATHWDYPERPPLMRVAPVVELEPGQQVADMFETWWRSGDLFDDPPGWTWNEETHLVDYIQAIEAHHDLNSLRVTAESTQEDDYDVG